MSDMAVSASSRLHWQCRRGMRELDELLQIFLERGYSQLNDTQRMTFERLLTRQDNLLLEYFMGRSVPKDSDIADVVAKIRHAARP